MIHKRRALLEVIRTQLKELGHGAWIQRVPPPRAQFPCLTVFAGAEAVTTLTINLPSRPQDRLLTVFVQGWIRGTPDDEKAESDLDALALEIESVMSRPAMADDILLTSTEVEINEEDPEVHVLTMTFQLQYQTTEFLPT